MEIGEPVTTIVAAPLDLSLSDRRTASDAASIAPPAEQGRAVPDRVVPAAATPAAR